MILRRVATALVLIPFVVGLVLWTPLWLFLLALGLFLLITLWEFFRLFPAYQARPLVLLYLLTGVLPWIWSYQQDWVFPYLLLSALLVLLAALILSGDLRAGLPTAAFNLTALLYLGVPYSLLALHHPQFEPGSYDRARGLGLLIALTVIWVADSAAYFVGRWMGRHRITPVLSPSKTLEGYVAGLLAAPLACWALATLLLQQWPALPALMIGLTLGAAAVAGDLFESFLKRGAGVKDTSSLIPGHGGVLDRVDSMLWGIPTYHLIWWLTK